MAVAIATVPYVIAPALLNSGSSFTGFLINPIDGFSYLAKMQQGAEFTIEFRLPYASEPGPGVALFVYQQVLGGIGSLLGAPPILTYHTARVVGALAMFGSSYYFFARALPERRAKWGAFVLTLFGTGIGWIGVLGGVLPIDIWVPEAIPLLSAYANAHFPLATAMLVVAVTLVLYDDVVSRARLPILFLVGFLLALIQPFAVVALGLILTLWLFVERLISNRLDRSIIGLASFAAGALPVLVYTWGVIQQHTVLSEWNAQNRTPTPGLLEVLLGYGLVLVFAAVGALLSDARKLPAGRLLITWVAAGIVMIYLPIPIQRRLTLGLFIPLAGLAGLGLDAVASTGRRFTLLLIALLLLSIPSHIMVVGSGLFAVSRGEAGVVIAEDDAELMEWVAVNVPERSLVLAGTDTGNRLPAYSRVRVLYGHPFETPDATRQKDRVRELWSWDRDPSDGIRALRAAGVDYAFYGEEEKAFGSPSWIQLAELAHRAGSSELYKVPES